MARWPEVGVALWAELERNPGRFALLVGSEARTAAEGLADLRGAVPTRVGEALTAGTARPSEPAVRARLQGCPVLVDLEILFDPILALDPVRLLAALAKEHPPVVAVWPVITGSDRLQYPPGVTPRVHTARDLQGCLLITTCPTTFADDPPFTSERLC